MWQRFTERARKVVFYAQEEAQKFGEGYVSTEHLLLGLVREEDCTAAVILAQLGISLSNVRAEVEKQLPRGDNRPSQDMTLTPRAKRVIDLAFNEAERLDHSYIGSEHLLLGLVREGDGLAGRVLHKLGVRLNDCRPLAASLERGSREEVNSTPREPNPRRHGDLHRSMSLMHSVMAGAWAHAEADGVAEASTEHILMAISEMSIGRAQEILSLYGLTPDAIWENIVGPSEEPHQDPPT